MIEGTEVFEIESLSSFGPLVVGAFLATVVLVAFAETPGAVATPTIASNASPAIESAKFRTHRIFTWSPL
jgi:hypothetical protein